MEINFDVDENLIKETNITKADLSSNLWEIYMGAYGSILDEITILAKDIPHTEEENKQFETAFDNLCENLWHQMSFYNASYLFGKEVLWTVIYSGIFRIENKRRFVRYGV